MAERLAILKKEISKLEDHEQKLDMHKQVCCIDQVNNNLFLSWDVLVSRVTRLQAG
jgi:hypothetical protein